ncbi:MAG: hypothetical protein ABEJ61_02535 [Haloferacaceae archaeon]
MGLQRVGTLLAGVGLTVAALWAVAVGATVDCAGAACPGVVPTYRLVGVDLATATVRVSDGCTTCVVGRPVLAGAVVAALGVALAAVGLARNERI